MNTTNRDSGSNVPFIIERIASARWHSRPQKQIAIEHRSKKQKGYVSGEGCKASSHGDMQVDAEGTCLAKLS